MTIKEKLAEYALKYRESDKHKANMHVDIFAIPESEVNMSHITSIIGKVTDEIVRNTDMNREEAREYFRDADVDTWFDEHFSLDGEEYHVFFVRYELPLRSYQQGVKATMELKY